MSFILDALRKSEHDRQRSSGPGLAEVAVARPAPRGNPWAAIAIGLLLLNLLLVGAWMLRKALRADSAAVPTLANAPQPQGPATPTTTMTQTRPPAPRALPMAPSQSSPVPPGGPPMMRAAERPAAASGATNPLQNEVQAGPAAQDDGFAPRFEGGGPSAAQSGSSGSVQTRGGRVVYESQPLDAAPGMREAGSPGSSPESGLPAAEDVAAQMGLPELHLDIHVYGIGPQDRFVFVNGRKYREGEPLQEGPSVERITAEGVVLSFQGKRFALERP